MNTLDFNSMVFVWQQAELLMYDHVREITPTGHPFPYPPNINVGKRSKATLCERTREIYEYLLEHAPEQLMRLSHVLHTHLHETEVAGSLDALRANSTVNGSTLVAALEEYIGANNTEATREAVSQNILTHFGTRIQPDASLGNIVREDLGSPSQGEW